jgi:XTP/dITP diphosphohydrolase
MSFHLYAATTSQGKLRDFRAASSAHTLVIEPLPDLKKIPAPEEDGLTFAANAILKALYYSRFAPGELVLADDSGLEVDALGGAPGVRSARFAADAGFASGKDTDQNNNLLLIERLNGVPAAQRAARYRCVLAAACDGRILHTAAGTVEGVILKSPQGTGGFGYDPLFFLPALNRSMAELDLATKNTLSHRGRALAALIPLLGL